MGLPAYYGFWQTARASTETMKRNSGYTINTVAIKQTSDRQVSEGRSCVLSQLSFLSWDFVKWIESQSHDVTSGLASVPLASVTHCYFSSSICLSFRKTEACSRGLLFVFQDKSPSTTADTVLCERRKNYMCHFSFMCLLPALHLHFIYTTNQCFLSVHEGNQHGSV